MSTWDDEGERRSRLEGEITEDNEVRAEDKEQGEDDPWKDVVPPSEEEPVPPEEESPPTPPVEKPPTPPPPVEKRPQEQPIIKQTPSQPENEEPERRLLSPEELEKIRKETIDLMKMTTDRVGEQLDGIHQQSYLVTTMNDGAKVYDKFMGGMNKFLVNSNNIQSDWYRTMSQILPDYGDYEEVINKGPDKIDVIVKCELQTLRKRCMLTLMQDVVNNMYASGAQVKALVHTLREINMSLSAKHEISTQVSNDNLCRWLNLSNDLQRKQETILRNIGVLKNYVYFHENEEADVPLELDLGF